MKRLILAIALLVGCSSNRVDDIKAHAEARWRELGFEVVGYDGYQLGGPGACWGGAVWYILRKIPDNGITYGGYLCKWGNEYHMYSLYAIDAIRPQ